MSGNEVEHKVIIYCSLPTVKSNSLADSKWFKMLEGFFDSSFIFFI